MKHHLLVIVGLMLCICGFAKEPQRPTSYNYQRGLEALVNGSTMQIDTTYNLIVFKPNFSRVELEVGKMPEQQNDSVLFCAAAAFTSEELTDFSHDNIVGAYLTHGKHYHGKEVGNKYGRFVYANKHWQFVEKTDSVAFDEAANNGGCAFTQMWVIKDNQIYRPYARRDSTQQNIYRCLCVRNDTLMVAQCRKIIPYHLFVKALQSYGINNALYMDMGSGWNHSYYRDNNDSLHILFPYAEKTKFCTNWITFYK